MCLERRGEAKAKSMIEFDVLLKDQYVGVSSSKMAISFSVMQLKTIRPLKFILYTRDIKKRLKH